MADPAEIAGVGSAAIASGTAGGLLVFAFRQWVGLIELWKTQAESAAEREKIEIERRAKAEADRDKWREAYWAARGGDDVIGG